MNLNDFCMLSFKGFIYHFSLEKAKIGSNCLDIVDMKCTGLFKNTEEDSERFVIKATDNINL